VEVEKLLDHRRPKMLEGELTRLEGVRSMIEDHYERRLQHLDADCAAARQRLQAEYDRLMPKGVREAGIPHIDMRIGAVDVGQPTGSAPTRMVKRPITSASARCRG
jgi:hypothetical protein